MWGPRKLLFRVSGFRIWM